MIMHFINSHLKNFKFHKCLMELSDGINWKKILLSIVQSYINLPSTISGIFRGILFIQFGTSGSSRMLKV